MVKVAFFHPDLGIGGAERLIIEIALALKDSKHDVTIFTTHHDKKHCFSETSDGQIPVVSKGDWIPRSIFKGFMAYLAALRIIFLCIYFLIFERKNFNVVIVDQISVIAVPLLKLFRIPVIFYCHYPDQLLSTRNSFVKKLYRIIIDRAESYCASVSDIVLVNSNFTQNAVLNTFPSLKDEYKKNANLIKIAYPCVSSKTFNSNLPIIPIEGNIYKFMFVSINRYETKKGIDVALKAMVMLRSMVSEEVWEQTQLVLMGGFDPRLPDNIQCFNNISAYALKNKLLKSIDDNNDDIKRVRILSNVDDRVKIAYLQRAIGLLYTPENEHFGIVPIEAMMMGVPVIAVNSGGPLETVIDKVTGFLGPQTPEHFCESMKFLIENELIRTEMIKAAKIHSAKHFTEAALKESMNLVFKQLNI